MECNCKQCRGNRGIRPVEDVSAVEWARYEKAKRTTDPAKLRALLPPWIRAHMAAVKFPAPFEFIPGRPPVYPNLFTSLTAHSFSGWVAEWAGDENHWICTGIRRGAIVSRRLRRRRRTVPAGRWQVVKYGGSKMNAILKSPDSIRARDGAAGRGVVVETHYRLELLDRRALMDTTIYQGKLARYTGKSIKRDGQRLHEIELLEGPEKGRTKLTPRAPGYEVKNERLREALIMCHTSDGAMASRSHKYALRRLAAINELTAAALEVTK